MKKVLLLILPALIIVGCSQHNAYVEEVVNNGDEIEEINAYVEEVVDNGDEMEEIFEGILEPKSVEDLFMQSLLVVKGQTQGTPNSFIIESVNGVTSVFTDYQFKVDYIYRGSDDNKIINIRVQGGIVGNRKEIYNPTPDLEYDGEMILFLYKPGRGGGFNTEGDYYYVLGLPQGLFKKYEGKWKSSMGTVLTEEDIEQKSKVYPVDEYWFRNEYLENLKRNLDNDMITEEEYNKWTKEIDVFAKIRE